MEVSRGITDQGIVIGNTYDKYGSRNPIVRWMMRGFETALLELLHEAQPGSIHEVGCGEGYWVLNWRETGYDVRGTDFSQAVIEMASSNARARGFSGDLFEIRSVYELIEGRDSADIVVCCEVLEHLDDPEKALAILQRVVQRSVILSVPREPLWRILNVTRGKYLGALGNTPGHLQHWSKSEFVELVKRYFDIVEVRAPMPWTMLLAQRRG